MSRDSRLLVSTALAAPFLACGDPSTETGSAGTVTTVDSAGVEIVRISELRALDLPEVELRLVHSTSAVPDLHVERVAGAVFLPDTSLVIGDGGASELVFLDRDGSVRARSGREGEGPGEYGWIERIGVGVDGAPFVFDTRQRGFTFLDAQGEVTRVHRLDQGAGLGAAVPLIRVETGEVLAALETRPSLPRGLRRGPVFLVLADATGEIVDTLGEWAGKERFVTDDWEPVGFGLTALFAGRGRHALVGTNDSLDLTLYRGVEPVTRIRGGYSAREVTAAEKDEWTERFLAMFPEDYRPGWRERLERSMIRDTYPAYGAIGVEADGRILDRGLSEAGRRDAAVDDPGPRRHAGGGPEPAGAAPHVARGHGRRDQPAPRGAGRGPRTDRRAAPRRVRRGIRGGVGDGGRAVAMTRTRIVRKIDAPVKAVFDAVADASNFSRAVPDIVRVEFLGESRVGVGTRFRETRVMRGREASTVLEVTEYVRNERVRMVADAGGTVWDSLFTVMGVGEGDGERVRLELVMEARPYRLMARLLVPLMRRVVAKAVEGDMDAVKGWCEGG